MFSKQEISVLHTTKRKFLKSLLTTLDNTNYDHYSSRIKTNDSIKNKLIRKQLKANPVNAVVNLTDIIGIRIVTQYIRDVYDVVRKIRENYTIKEECDYIANPKPSGYRSFHMVITVPIVNNNFTFPYSDTIDVEIQIRTMGMDFWASLEHSVVYDKKKTTRNYDENSMSLIHNELVNYAEDIFSIDMRIQALQHLTEHNEKHP